MDFEKVSPERFINDELREGEFVEVEVSPYVWVPATVTNDMETRVSVALNAPLLVIERTVIKIVTHIPILSFFFHQKIKETEEIRDTYTTTWTSGRWYIRRPL